MSLFFNMDFITKKCKTKQVTCYIFYSEKPIEKGWKLMNSSGHIQTKTFQEHTTLAATSFWRQTLKRDNYITKWFINIIALNASYINKIYTSCGFKKLNCNFLRLRCSMIIAYSPFLSPITLLTSVILSTSSFMV